MSSRLAAEAFLAAQARQVLNVYPDKALDDVKADLRHTGDVQRTIERILSGQFLNGTAKDPSLATVILLSDDVEILDSDTGVPSPGMGVGPKARKPAKMPPASPARKRTPKRAADEFLDISDFSDDLPPPPDFSTPSKLSSTAGNSKDLSRSPKASRSGADRTGRRSIGSGTSLSPTRHRASIGRDEPVNDPIAFSSLPTLEEAREGKGKGRDKGKQKQTTQGESSNPASRPKPKPIEIDLCDSDDDPVGMSGPSKPSITTYTGAPSPGSRTNTTTLRALSRSVTAVNAIELPSSDSDDGLPPAELSQLSQLSQQSTKSSRPSKPASKPARAASPDLPLFSSRTAELLAALDEELGQSSSDSDSFSTPKRKKPARPPAGNKRRKVSTALPTIHSDSPPPGGSQGVSSSAPKPSRSRLSEEEKARRAAEKARKEAERNTLKEERAIAKAQKESEKAERAKKREQEKAEKQYAQELASVNKLRPSKKESSKDMIVDLSRSLSASALGGVLIPFLKREWMCEVKEHWTPSAGVEGGWKLVKWRRKTRREFSHEKGMWLPLPNGEEREEEEKQLLVYLTALEFVELVAEDELRKESGDREGMGLNEHVGRLKRLLPQLGGEVKVIYLIEGLDAYMRKHKNAASRSFQEQVRSAITLNSSSTPASPSKRKSRSNNPPAVPAAIIEAALLRLQLTHTVQIQHTSSVPETSEAISLFTASISTLSHKPPSSSSAADTSFCTDVGQVKPGVDAQDTFRRMLEQVHRVTPAAAAAIEAEFPGGVVDLVEVLRMRGGETALEDISIGRRADGAVSRREVGKAVSRRVWAAFLGRDEGAFVEV